MLHVHETFQLVYKSCITGTVAAQYIISTPPNDVDVCVFYYLFFYFSVINLLVDVGILFKVQGVDLKDGINLNDFPEKAKQLSEAFGYSFAQAFMSKVNFYNMSKGCTF